MCSTTVNTLSFSGDGRGLPNRQLSNIQQITKSNTTNIQHRKTHTHLSANDKKATVAGCPGMMMTVCFLFNRYV